MQKLFSHINYLLWRHECVILPGFGAFVAHNMSAVYDAKTGMFNPPSRKICFNPDIVNNDGLLANSIARKDKISFEAASALLLRLIADLRATLDKAIPVTVEGVGNLIPGFDSSLTFEPEEKTGVFSLLPCIEMLDAAKEKEDRRLVAVGDDDRFYHFRLDKRLVRFAAMVAVILLAGLSFLIPGGIGFPVEKASVLPVELKPASFPHDDVVAGREKVKEESAIIVPEEEVTADEPPKKCHLIVAALKSPKEVEIFLSQHAGSDYKLSVLPGKKLMRISAADADNASDLREVMKSRDFTAEFPDAWIFQEKH